MALDRQTPTVSLRRQKEKNSPSDWELPEGLDWPRRLWTCVIYCIASARGLDSSETNNMPLDSNLVWQCRPPSSLVSGDGCRFADATTRHPFTMSQLRPCRPLLDWTSRLGADYGLPALTKVDMPGFRVFLIITKLGGCHHHWLYFTEHPDLALLDYTKICNGSPPRGAAFQGSLPTTGGTINQG